MTRVKVNTLVYHPDEPLSRLVMAGEEIPEGWSERSAPVSKKKRTVKKRGTSKNTKATA